MYLKLLINIGSMENAIRNAKKIAKVGGKYADYNPATAVYKIVEELIKEAEESQI